LVLAQGANEQKAPTPAELKEAVTQAQKAIGDLNTYKTDSKVAADTLWVMITAMLVFFMNLGFACVESGFCRAKNCVNILSKNFVVFAVTSIGFWLVGWGLMFGNGNAWVGTEGLWSVGGPDNSPTLASPTFEDKLKADIKEKLGIDLKDEAAAKEHPKVLSAVEEAVKKFNNTTTNKIDKKDNKGVVITDKDGKPEKEDNTVQVTIEVAGKAKFEESYKTADFYWGAYSALAWAGVPLWAKFFFQLVFAGTAATIVSGAVAERIKYHSFIVFSFVMAIGIYPVVGHWVWGAGKLQSAGFVDFAGSTQVHSIGGWAALIGIIILGPRIGRYGPNGKVNAIPGHNLTAATIGCFILWFGWFGFNPGSTMAADPAVIAEVAITTNLAAAAATLSATVVAWLLLGKPDLGMTLNGCLAGLVAITAPCAFVSAGAALLIGLIAGVLVVLAVLMFDRLRLDDPVGATSVHLVNGVFGTLCVGLFATPDRIGRAANPEAVAGLFYGGGTKQLLMQLTGVGYTAVYVCLAAAVTWLVLKYTIGIRVSREEEIEGLDIGEHGNEAYHGFVLEKAGEVASAPASIDLRPAMVPPGGSRFTVLVEGASNGELMHVWNDMCLPGKAPDANAFQAVYPYMTTVSGNRFHFRGGDATVIKEALAKLFAGKLSGKVAVTVEK
jgi:Amt family ammonium transporter